MSRKREIFTGFWAFFKSNFFLFKYAEEANDDWNSNCLELWNRVVSQSVIGIGWREGLVINYDWLKKRNYKFGMKIRHKVVSRTWGSIEAFGKLLQVLEFDSFTCLIISNIFCIFFLTSKWNLNPILIRNN